MKQSKKADALQIRVEKTGMKWRGWDDETKKWLIVFSGNTIFRRTLVEIEHTLDPDPPPIPVEVGPNDFSTEDEEAEKRLRLRPGYDPCYETPTVEVYRAEVGHHVTIDRGTENEMQGSVLEVLNGVVHVKIYKAKLRGVNRPDFVGTTIMPAQNGLRRPWGVTNSLTNHW